MTIKCMAFTATVTVFCLLVAVPAYAQRGPENGAFPRSSTPSPYSHRGPMAAPSGYGSRGPAMQSPSPYGSPTAHHGPVPSTRFGPGPDSGRYSGPPIVRHSPSQAAGPSHMQQSPHQPGYNTMSRPAPDVRTRSEDPQRMQPELSVQDRLKVPLLNHMYRQGADMVDEGRSQQDESKIKYGMQRMEDASRNLQHMEGPRGSSGDRNRGNNARNGRSRRD